MPAIPTLPNPLHDGDVTVRLFAERDIPEILIAYQDDPTLHHRLGLERPPTGAQLGSESERADAERIAGQRILLSIVATGDDVCRGRTIAENFEWDHRRAELGVWVAPQFRDRGYARRAVRLVAEWLFETCAMERLEVLIEPDNAPMLRVADAAGFTREGTLRGYRRDRRSRRDLVVCSLLPADVGSS